MSLLRVENVLVPKDLKTYRFGCNLGICHGGCCVEGEEGAPVTNAEAALIREHLDLFSEKTGRPYDRATFAYEFEDELHLQMLPNRGACAFSYQENGVTLCSLQAAHDDGDFPIPKPLSCHLYPLILIPMSRGKYLLSISRRETCNGCMNRGPLLVDFLQTPLERALGKAWYAKLREKLKLDAIFE